MGTPEFAVAPLQALVESGEQIVAVVTMPDKPSGRGMKLQQSPVKQYAQAIGIPVLQPEKLKDESFVQTLRYYHADLQIVVAFRMLPEVVWAMPRLGTFNLHASLLPQYRGAAPINWAVINGEKFTGVTTFMLKHEIDTGNIIMQRRIPIGDDENVGSVHDRLMNIGSELVLQTVQKIAESDQNGTTLQTIAQDDIRIADCKPAPKIFKEDCAIDLSKTAEQVHNFVRGLSPYPAAWTDLTIDHKTYNGVKIYAVAKGQGAITLQCADGPISVLELQLPGKKRMDAKALLNGLR